MAEQLGAQACGCKGAAEPDHEGDQPQTRARLRPLAAADSLDSKRREANEARVSRLKRCNERAMSEEGEEVLLAGLEAAPPARDQLAARPELARDLARAAPGDPHPRDCVEDEADRVNLSRQGVAGEDPLPCSTVSATGQDHGEPLVVPVPPREATLDPGAREREPSASAACAMAAIENLVASSSERAVVVARLDSRYVDHVLLDDPTSRPSKSARGVVFLYAKRPPIAQEGLLAAGNARRGLRFSRSEGHDSRASAKAASLPSKVARTRFPCGRGRGGGAGSGLTTKPRSLISRITSSGVRT